MLEFTEQPVLVIPTPTLAAGAVLRGRDRLWGRPRHAPSGEHGRDPGNQAESQHLVKGQTVDVGLQLFLGRPAEPDLAMALTTFLHCATTLPLPHARSPRPTRALLAPLGAVACSTCSRSKISS